MVILRASKAILPILLKYLRKPGPTAWLQITGLLRGGAPFLQSLLLSKIWGPGPFLAGFETLSMAVNAAAFTGLWTVTVYFVPAYSGASSLRERETVMSLSLLALFLNGLFAAAAVVAYGCSTGYSTAATVGFAVYALGSVSAALTEYLLWAQKKYVATGVYSVMAYGLTAFAPPVAAYFFRSLETTGLVLAAVALLRWGYAWILARGSLTFARGGGWKKQGKLMSAPALSSLLGGSVAYIDGFLSRHRLGESEFLFFRYGGRELPVALMLANAVATAGAGFVAAAHRDGNPEAGYRKLKADGARLMHVVFPLTMLLLVVSGPLFELVYHAGLRPAAQIFDLFLLLAVPRMLFPQSALLGLGLNKYTLYGSLWEWPVHVGLSLALIGPMGMFGPALATLTAYFFGKGMLAFYAHKAGVKLHQYTATRLWALYSLGVFAVYVAKSLIF